VLKNFATLRLRVKVFALSLNLFLDLELLVPNRIWSRIGQCKFESRTISRYNVGLPVSPPCARNAGRWANSPAAFGFQARCLPTARISRKSRRKFEFIREIRSWFFIATQRRETTQTQDADNSALLTGKCLCRIFDTRSGTTFHVEK
jgi:hypothetical protein